MDTNKLVRLLIYFPHRLQIKTYSNKSKAKEKNRYSQTVQLPKTEFPQWMGASKRIETDDFILKNCGFSGLYDWQKQNLDGTEFILHDGPPYANGLPHMGHAINKILKDIINRSKVLVGTKVNFVPGWDCHGLPIELKALKGKVDIHPLKIRGKAREYAKQAINDQRIIFKTWGLMADWEKDCYYTFDERYVKNQLQQFFNLYQKNLIYRDMKPVYWSPSSKTALAEAELQYKEDHESDAVTLRLKVVEGGLFEQYNPLYLLIWTTTPWSLPANEAVAYNSLFEYSIFQMNNENFIICSNLLQKFIEKAKMDVKEICRVRGNALSDCKYEHPLRRDVKPLLSAKYVTDDVGTGLVHTAPSHGPDDYLLAIENNLPIFSYVDDSGKYTKEAGDPLENLSAMDNGMKKVMTLLNKDIIVHEKIKHAYPYDWRTNKPTMIRASKQWFIDTKAIKSSAVDSLKNIKIIPGRNIAGLLSQIENRPYWCISRQRAWGVPIPVLYDQDEKVIISKELIDHFCSLIDKQGTDFWWLCSKSDLISPNMSNKLGIDIKDIKNGEDILDIWFDSGLSWSAVLNEKVADLYLEGIDQFTGWFQSSLLTSIALRNHPPYRAILAHGFAVDDEGRKMSKSIGNVIDPQEIIFGSQNKKFKPLGIDVLRWWVAAHSLQHTNIPVSASTLDDSVNALKKIRNILKFLLGSIYDLPTDVKPSLHLIDHYILLKSEELRKKVTDMYGDYEFNKICMVLLNFLTNDLSSFYCTITKDRLYCDNVESESRRAVQVTMNEVFYRLLHMIGPIVPVLAEEAFLHHPHNKDKSHFFYGNWKPSSPFTFKENEYVISVIEEGLLLKEKLLKEKPFNIDISKLSCTILAGDRFWNDLKALQDTETSNSSELVELLQTAEVTLVKSDTISDFTISLEVSKNYFCERCRKYTSKEINHPCKRCRIVLEKFS